MEVLPRDRSNQTLQLIQPDRLNQKNQFDNRLKQTLYLECCEHYSQLAIFQVALNQVLYEVDLCSEMLNPSTNNDVMKDGKQFVHRPLITAANVRLHQLKQHRLLSQFNSSYNTHRQQKLRFSQQHFEHFNETAVAAMHRETSEEITTAICLVTMRMLNSESQLLINIFYQSTTPQSIYSTSGVPSSHASAFPSFQSSTDHGPVSGDD